MNIQTKAIRITDVMNALMRQIVLTKSLSGDVKEYGTASRRAKFFASQLLDVFVRPNSMVLEQLHAENREQPIAQPFTEKQVREYMAAMASGDISTTNKNWVDWVASSTLLLQQHGDMATFDIDIDHLDMTQRLYEIQLNPTVYAVNDMILALKTIGKVVSTVKFPLTQAMDITAPGVYGISRPVSLYIPNQKAADRFLDGLEKLDKTPAVESTLPYVQMGNIMNLVQMSHLFTAPLTLEVNTIRSCLLWHAQRLTAQQSNTSVDNARLPVRTILDMCKNTIWAPLRKSGTVGNTRLYLEYIDLAHYLCQAWYVTFAKGEDFAAAGTIEMYGNKFEMSEDKDSYQYLTKARLGSMCEALADYRRRIVAYGQTAALPYLPFGAADVDDSSAINHQDMVQDLNWFIATVISELNFEELAWGNY